MKITCFLSNRASYFRQKPLLLKMKEEFDLTLLLTSSLLNVNQNNVFRDIISETFECHAITLRSYEGTLGSMAISSAELSYSAAIYLSREKPDALMLIADRFELLPVAMAAAYLNIPIIHIQGGEVSGNIDDKVRNSVSMLSDLHLVSHYEAYQRLTSMGLKHVFNTGCPSIDFIRECAPEGEKKDQVVCIFHPHTKEVEAASFQTEKVYKQVGSFCKQNGLRLYWFAPNNDPGHIYVHSALEGVDVIYSLLGAEFIKLLASSRMIVGNSSAGLRESSFLGLPCVNIGKRQEGRVRAGNVIDSGFENIAEKMGEALLMKPEPSVLFGDGNATRRIIESIKQWGNECLKKN